MPPVPVPATPGPLRPDGLAPDTPPRWIGARIPVVFNPFLRFFLFLVFMMVPSIIGGIALVAIQGPERAQAPGNPAIMGLQLIAAIIAYLLLVLWIEKRRPAHEIAPRRIGGLLPGLGIGAGAMIVCFALIWVLGGFTIAGLRTPEWSGWATNLFVFGAVAGISEEIMFRGVLYRLTEELLGTWGAVTVSALAFGLVHLGNSDATWLGAIGIVLEAGISFALLYALTRSLWVTIGMHAAWNIVQGPILGVIVSGTGAPNGFLTVIPKGPEVISGGRFGLEASLITVVVLLAFSVWLGVRLVRSGNVVAPMWVRRARQRSLIDDGHRAARDAGQLPGLVGQADLPHLSTPAQIDRPGLAADPALCGRPDVVGVDLHAEGPLGGGIDGGVRPQRAEGLGQQDR